MATAKKQPSGMWRVRVYSHTDADGKQHMRAFTAPTKAEAEAMAASFQGKADRAARVDLTVGEAIDGYIDAKEGVLSPSTIGGYRQLARTSYASISHDRIRKLTTERVQRFVSELAQEKSPKTVKNVYSLLASAVALYLPDVVFRVKLPARIKRRVPAPSDAQVMALYNAADPWLRICIGLAAFCGLRRGEITALRYGDITDGVVHVHADMVKDSSGRYVYKSMPKTEDSVRDVYVPEQILQLIGSGDPDAFIIKYRTDTVTQAFNDLRGSLGITGVRFHDLRAYYASIGAVLIPSTYLARFGGWTKSSGVMQEVYQREITDRTKVYADQMTGYFSELLEKS